MTFPRNKFMESAPFLLVFVLGYCLAMIEGELRCYCNASGCVATGYMCKSSANKCFTAVEIRGEATHLTHGCLETLPEEHQRSCRVDAISASKADWVTGHLPLLLCCTEDMCNYREDIDVSIVLTPKYNGTFHRGKSPTKQDSAISSRNPHGSRDDDRDLWFKAAVIAVPIAGGFILVLLVLLAVRMLRTDSRPHTRLIQIRQERSLTKTHMYISEHFSDKSSKRHCSLFNEKTNRTHVPLFSDGTTDKSNKTNSRAVSASHSSFVDDTTSAYCSNPQHSENKQQPDSGSVHGSVNHSSLPCCPNYRTLPHITCSTNNNLRIKDSRHLKVCSYVIGTPSGNMNLQQNVNVKPSKDGHPIHRDTELHLDGTHHKTDRQPLPVCSWKVGSPAGSALV